MRGDLEKWLVLCIWSTCVSLPLLSSLFVRFGSVRFSFRVFARNYSSTHRYFSPFPLPDVYNSTFSSSLIYSIHLFFTICAVSDFFFSFLIAIIHLVTSIRSYIWSWVQSISCFEVMGLLALPEFRTNPKIYNFNKGSIWIYH